MCTHHQRSKNSAVHATHHILGCRQASRGSTCSSDILASYPCWRRERRASSGADRQGAVRAARIWRWRL
jgi:hypothetical protein